MAPENRLLWQGPCELLGNKGVHFVHQLLNHLRGGGGIKDIMLDGDVLIVQLLKEAEGCDRLASSTEAGFAELLRYSLQVTKLRLAMKTDGRLHNSEEMM